MTNIEVEIRSFISERQYLDLLSYFKQHANLIKKDNQITYYFQGEQDLRIQKNEYYSKIWLKSGKIHEEQREELEIKFTREQFSDLVELFQKLGYEIDIKWIRERVEFDWEGVKICLDKTKGYGYIIEVEKMSTPEEKDADLSLLRTKLEKLNIQLTPKDVFTQKYEEYRQNWRSLIQE